MQAPGPKAAAVVRSLAAGAAAQRDAYHVFRQNSDLVYVRIEDDLVITAGGNEVLTAACPKQIEELERACRSSTSPSSPLSQLAQIRTGT